MDINMLAFVALIFSMLIEILIKQINVMVVIQLTPFIILSIYVFKLYLLDVVLL